MGGIHAVKIIVPYQEAAAALLVYVSQRYRSKAMHTESKFCNNSWKVALRCCEKKYPWMELCQQI